MTLAQWYAMHNCTHAHCPYECEHPQPFMDGDRAVCGRCAHVEERETEMIPCTPETCIE